MNGTEEPELPPIKFVSRDELGPEPITPAAITPGTRRSLSRKTRGWVVLILLVGSVARVFAHNHASSSQTITPLATPSRGVNLCENYNYSPATLKCLQFGSIISGSAQQAGPYIVSLQNSDGSPFGASRLTVRVEQDSSEGTFLKEGK